MIIGFTGTREGMTSMQRNTLPALLFRLRLTNARHGDCIGADKQFHVIIRARFQEAKIHGHPGPDSPLRAHCQFDTCAEPKEYLKRNMDIVQFSDALVAVPKEEKEIQRSGTWATFRYAKSIGRLAILIYPDGEYEVFF